jgi:serine/threonine protein kinase
MAPELMYGAKATRSSDVYLFGMTIYEVRIRWFLDLLAGLMNGNEDIQ